MERGPPSGAGRLRRRRSWGGHATAMLCAAPATTAVQGTPSPPPGLQRPAVQPVQVQLLQSSLRSTVQTRRTSRQDDGRSPPSAPAQDAPTTDAGNFANGDYKDCSKLLDEAVRSFSTLLYVCIVFALQMKLGKFQKIVTEVKLHV